MSRDLHMGIGREWLARWLEIQVTGDDVSRPDLTGPEAAALVRQDQREVLPVQADCDRWHPVTGCQGHEGE